MYPFCALVQPEQNLTARICGKLASMVHNSELLPLQEHCWRLALTLTDLWDHDPATLNAGRRDYDFSDAAAWLHLASSVVKVEADTARFDDSIMWCGNAAIFEDARSELYARLVTELTMFMFVWGAFETVAKVIGPEPIPREARDSGGDGLVDRVLYRLRDFEPLPAYAKALQELLAAMTSEPATAGPAVQTYPKHMGPSVHGLHLVRRIRNRFAHGIGGLPLPDVTNSG